MASTTDPTQEHRLDLVRLTRRVHTLESVALRSGVVVVVALFVLGLALPYVRESKGETHSILGLLFDGGSYGSDGVDIFFETAFWVLVAVVVLCLFTLFPVWRRQASRRTATLLRVLLVVVTLGVAGAWLTLLVSLSQTDNQFGAAVLLLTAAAVGYGVIAVGGRTWWVDDGPVR